MVTGELRNKIDSLWEIFWTGGLTNPLDVIENGIVYDELSEEDKQEYEETFENEDGELPERISSSALNNWIFNEDTIREVLNVLMTNGLRVDYGNKIGKTIIFAKNHRHAEKILEVFGKEYPNLKDYANAAA